MEREDEAREHACHIFDCACVRDACACVRHAWMNKNIII